MKYLVKGMGCCLRSDDIDCLPINKKYQKPITEVVEAKSKEDALYKAYEAVGDGFWKSDEIFVWFAEKPTVTQVPEDQMMKEIGAPMLPGFMA